MFWLQYAYFRMAINTLRLQKDNGLEMLNPHSREKTEPSIIRNATFCTYSSSGQYHNLATAQW